MPATSAVLHNRVRSNSAVAPVGGREPAAAEGRHGNARRPRWQNTTIFATVALMCRTAMVVTSGIKAVRGGGVWAKLRLVGASPALAAIVFGLTRARRDTRQGAWNHGHRPYDSERIKRVTARLRVILYVALGLPPAVAMVAVVYLLASGAAGSAL